MKEAYDFIQSVIEYEDQEYLIPLTSAEEAAEHVRMYIESWGDEFPQDLRDPETLMAVWNDCIPAPEEPENDPAKAQYLLRATIEGETFNSIVTGKKLADIYEQDQIAGIYRSMTAWALDGEDPRRINILDVVSPILEQKRWMEQEYRDYCEEQRYYGQ